MVWVYHKDNTAILAHTGAPGWEFWPKTTARKLELAQPVLQELVFVLGMSVMLLPPFVTPRALQAAARGGGDVLAGFTKKYFENLERWKTQP